MAQWVSAVLSAKGESDAIPKADAIEIIHATPASDRSKFAREIWRKRRGGHNPSELLIFGNPPKGHKPNCKCPFCKRARSGPPSRQKQALRRASRNPSESHLAVKLFESFHGKKASEIIEAQRSAVMRLDYTAIGPLVALGFDDCEFSESKLVSQWDQCPNIGFDGDKVKLASAPNGRQIYFIGGNQNLDPCLEQFEGIDPQKDLIDLGEVFFVVYVARKVHSKFEPVEWMHRFGDKNKTRPRLAYDKLKKEITLIGGEYFIDTKQGVSPGIEG